MNKKVLVIGDIMLDNYVYGSCSRISPEAPVPVFEYGTETKMLGGAANVVKNLISLSLDCELISIIGEDDSSKIMIDLLNQIGVKADGLVLIKNRPTTLKQRFIAANQQLLRLDREVNSLIDNTTEDKVYSKYLEKVEESEIIIISDYAKGLVTPVLCQKIISHANSNGKRVLIDPKGNDYSKYSGAFLVKPNLKEFDQITQKTHHSKVEIYSSAEELKEKLNINTLLITLGDKGIFALGDEAIFSPTISSEVFDVSGAGDTVLACVAYGIINDYNLDYLCRFANGGASIVISKFGSQTTNVDEILKKIKLNEESTD